jgi:hypothetical protein
MIKFEENGGQICKYSHIANQIEATLGLNP